MNIKATLITLFVMMTTTVMFAQDFSYAIKAGLNYSTVTGEKEANETQGYNVGFQIGAAFNIGFREDQLGASLEVNYIQRGGRMGYEGDSYMVLPTISSNPIMGLRDDATTFDNSYIDLPLLFYFRPKRFLKLSAGVSTGFLVSSTGSGETVFNGSINNDDVSYILAQDFNYLRDEPGGFPGQADLITITANGQTVEIPSTIGAYYFESEDQGNFFNTVDFAGVFDVTYYLSPGISLGARVNYSLVDVTNNAYDYSKVSNVKREDIDRNLGYQLLLAFNF